MPHLLPNAITPSSLASAPPIILPPFIDALITTLEEHGFQAFVVGGCVRDSLLGKSPKDWDIATSATPKQIKRVFAAYSPIAKGARFGTIGIIYPSSHISSAPYSLAPSRISDTQAPIIEITTFRTESAYINNRHPARISYTTNFLLDILRRDFTCNALGYNPHLASPSWQESPTLRALYQPYMPFLHDGICDYVGGRTHIISRILCATHNTSTTFCDDALRILRALRLLATHHFSLESSTKIALLENAPHLRAISAERKQEEWTKILYAPYFLRAIIGFECVWEVIFKGLMLHSLTHCLKANSMLHARAYNVLLALESINAPSTHSDKTLGDDNTSLRLSMWFHALISLDAPYMPHATCSNNIPIITAPHAALQLAHIEALLHDLRYKKRIISNCIMLLAHAHLSPSQSLTSSRLLASTLGLEKLSLLSTFLAHIHNAPCLISTHIAYIRANKLCHSLSTLAINGNDIKSLASMMKCKILGKHIGEILKALLHEVICHKQENTKYALLLRARALLIS